MKIKDLTASAFFAALICVAAPFSIYVGAIPITLATFAVYLTASVLPLRCSTASISLYVLLGAIGLPVFSEFEGGFQKITGITGGYIIGYILCGFVIGFMISKIKRKWVYPVSMVIGTVLCYILGMVWFVYQTKTDFGAAFIISVLPFLPCDIIKICLASILVIKLSKGSLKCPRIGQ